MKENKYFFNQYRCFDKPECLHDTIILPQSALEPLIEHNTDSPFQFRLTKNGKSIYCGVIEFTAPEKFIFASKELMDTLNVKNNQYVSLMSVTLPKAEFIKFKSEDPSFLQLSNPKIVVERYLRDRSTLMFNQTFEIKYIGKIYKFTITELKPEPIVSLKQADIQFEFESDSS